ncbi:MAG: hypothetical protein CMM74_10305 [Rhodospirillaceae bacterium]|nr:hypothetical protein [Rhodospirillaceae bacterium]
MADSLKRDGPGRHERRTGTWAWAVRAAVGQADGRGAGRGGRLDAYWRCRRKKMSPNPVG